MPPSACSAIAAAAKDLQSWDGTALEAVLHPQPQRDVEKDPLGDSQEEDYGGHKGPCSGMAATATLKAVFAGSDPSKAGSDSSKVNS